MLCPLSYGGAFDIVALIVRLAPSLQDACRTHKKAMRPKTHRGDS